MGGTTSGAKRLGGERPGGKRPWGETTKGGNGFLVSVFLLQLLTSPGRGNRVFKPVETLHLKTQTEKLINPD